MLRINFAGSDSWDIEYKFGRAIGAVVCARARRIHFDALIAETATVYESLSATGFLVCLVKTCHSFTSRCKNSKRELWQRSSRAKQTRMGTWTNPGFPDNRMINVVGASLPAGFERAQSER